MPTGSDIKYRIGADSSELVSELNKANAKLKEMQEQMKKGKVSTDDATAGFGKLANMLRAVVSSAVVAAAYKFMEFSGKVDSVTASFRGLTQGASMSSEQLVRSIAIASQGTMSNLEIMEQSNLALQLMGTQVAEQLPTIARIALATARATGQDVATAYGDLIKAGARQSVLILDNVGISSAAASGYMEEYARSIHTTSKNFTDAQKSAAFFYAVTKAGNDLVARTDLTFLSLGERLQIAKAQFENLLEVASGELRPAWEGVLSVFNAGGTDEMIQRVRTLSRELATLILTLTQVVRTAWAFRNVGVMDMVSGRMIWDSTTRNRIAQDLREMAEGNARDMQRIMDVWNGAALQSPATRSGPGRTGPTDTGGGAAKKKKDLSEYYEYVGQMREAELEKEYTQFRELLSMEGLTLQQREQIHEAHQQRINDIENKYNTFRVELIEGWSSAAESALGNFESATKSALTETLLGENGWAQWQKSLKKILAAFVVDIMWAVGKALLLQGIMMAINPGGAAGKAGGGFISGALGKFLEKGHVPILAKGSVPVLAGGNIPSDHELVWMDYKREAVINAQSTRANQELLNWINQNPGATAPMESGDRNITVQIDGQTIFEIMDNKRASRARSMGTVDYATRSVYR